MVIKEKSFNYIITYWQLFIKYRTEITGTQLATDESEIKYTLAKLELAFVLFYKIRLINDIYERMERFSRNFYDMFDD